MFALVGGRLPAGGAELYIVLCKEKRAARREIVYRNIIHYFILYTVSARVQEILWKLSDFNGLTIFGVFDLQGRPGQGQFFCRGIRSC